MYKFKGKYECYRATYYSSHILAQASLSTLLEATFITFMQLKQ